MATIKEIEVAFLARRAEIDALDQQLAKERRSTQISAIKANREMNSEEKQRLKQIGSTRQELAEALQVFSLVTLEQLESADDLSTLVLEISRINFMLVDDLSELERIEEYAEKVAKVVGGLASIAEKLASVVIT